MQPNVDPRLEASNVLAWILLNGFVNENNHPIEFTKHRFMIDYMADNSPMIVTKKAAQVGLTTMESLRNMHLAGYRHMNIIHTLQTSDVIKGFVFPKVNPIIEYNPKIKDLQKMDSESLKQFGDSFIFYRGANAESQAINISADILCVDEYDRSNQKVVEMYQSRLDASPYKWKRFFSNPSAVGFGVDGLFQKSNQYHWFVKCPHCGHESYLDWESDENFKNHYVHQELAIFACGKCDREIYNENRINGRWVAKYPTRDWHGYWFSQTMAPWVSAKELVDKFSSTTVEYFHNFVLGKAFTPTDLIVDRAAILRACSPALIPKTQVAIGVDNGIVKNWVAATPQGVFDYGKTESWDEIERLLLMYNAVMVIDANPYPNEPKRLAEKYRGRVFMNYYKQDTQNLGIVRWGKNDKRGVVYSDRTKIFDFVATEIAQSALPYRQSPQALEEYISHWSNIFRTTEIDAKGSERGVWVTQENKPDHYAHAHIYMRIALSKQLGVNIGMGFAEPLTNKQPNADYVDRQGQLHTGMNSLVSQALEGHNTNDWRYS